MPPLKVYLQEIKLLVSYIPLFVVWFAQITILTPTDIQIKDRITSFPIKIFLRSPLLSFLLFFNPFSSALIDACVRFDARIPALPHNLILNLQCISLRETKRIFQPGAGRGSVLARLMVIPLY